MRLEAILYRSRQLWQAIVAAPNPNTLALAEIALSPTQMALFGRLQTSEQAHSLQVFKRLYDESQQDPTEGLPDLLAAALLHDVGKCRYPLSVGERALIVLAKAAFPNRMEVWGSLPMSEKEAPPGEAHFGWKRAFVVASQHPGWGAEMAAAAGSSALTISLIRRHQDPLPERPETLEDRLLSRLQSADGSF